MIVCVFPKEEWIYTISYMSRAAHKGGGTKVTDRPQNADFRRKPQIFAYSPLVLGNSSIWRAQENHRKPKIFAEKRRKPQVGVRHLGSVTFSSALMNFTTFELHEYHVEDDLAFLKR